MVHLMKEIAQNVIEGRADKDSPYYPERIGQPGVKELVQRAIVQKIEVKTIINEGLLAGMNEVGARFKNGAMFIPEVVLSSQALKTGMEELKPLVIKSGLKTLSKVVIGTVKGDLHDVGKNLVKMMMEGAGFEVVDIGIDVSREKFIEAVMREKPQILGMSSLLTSTMAEMRPIIETLQEMGLSNQVKVMVGGAPVTQEYADKIDADGYALDAVRAVEKAKTLLGLN
jgi:5-methyltetrahydrofolate--homocysteine methyltransferase